MYIELYRIYDPLYTFHICACICPAWYAADILSRPYLSAHSYTVTSRSQVTGVVRSYVFAHLAASPVG